MAADEDAFAVLGLRPGADARAVERAYRDLIKRYHPDREGGDARQAAQLNQAYRAARANLERRDIGLYPFRPIRPPVWRRWLWAVALALIVALAVGAAIATDPEGKIVIPGVEQSQGAPSKSADPMARLVDQDSVVAAAWTAVRLSRSSGPGVLGQWSRNCQRQLRVRPDIDQFDRCTAFDDAAVTLAGSDERNFSRLEVTARQWDAAGLLSDDKFAVGQRLREIQRRVNEMLAAPPTAAN